ncbi:MAG: hypothetical protein HZB42_00385 [Sphingobacteriales bacterium]|nr:hypothetical protein [Sphingobacteriales bacterium]
MRKLTDDLKKLFIRNKGLRIKLEGSGISGTEITGRFSYAITKWIVEEFDNDVSLNSSQAASESVKLFFRQLLPAVEYESISDNELGLSQRIRKLKGNSSITPLKWLMQQLEASNLPEQTKEFLFNELNIFITWKIKNENYSRSRLRFPFEKISFSSQSNKSPDLNELLRKKLPPASELSKKEKLKLISIARATLVFLYRETDPFTYADPNEITLFELEDGISITLFGMDKDHRFSIESYIGYLVLKNGIPVAYGGGWIFGERCQFGINIPEPFRNSESGYIFSQLLRTYQQHYEVKRFVVKPYQFGKNNKEALRSGAFWFYYKFGFRPEEKNLLILAEKEANKKKRNKNYRSSTATLKRFTEANLYLNLTANPVPFFDASVISSAITNFINEKFNGNREAAIKESSKKLKELLQIKDFRSWDSCEKKVWKQWSLLANAALSIEAWDNGSKNQFIELIRSKAGKGEIDFIKKLQQHQRLWKDLNKKF